MKKSFIYSMAALLVAGAAFTACSSSENDIENGQPEQPEAKEYTLTVEAEKGDLVAPAGTRAKAEYDEVNEILKFTWEQYYEDLGKGDQVEVWADNGYDVQEKWCDLYAQSYGPSTTLSSKSNVGIQSVGTELTLKFNPSVDLSSTKQQGYLSGLAETYSAEAKVYVTSNDYGQIRTGKAVFKAQQAFVKFNLSHYVTYLKVNVDGKNYETATMEFAQKVVWMAIPGFEDKTVKVYDSESNLIKERDHVTMKNGEFWEITISD